MKKIILFAAAMLSAGVVIQPKSISAEEESKVIWKTDDSKRSIPYDEAGNELENGWYKDEAGNWYYFKRGKDGKLIEGWLADGDGWYHISGWDHRMDTGWRRIDGDDYYFSDDSEDIGTMQTGEKEIHGIMYRFDEEGRFLGNSWIEDERLGCLAKQLETEYEKEIYAVFDYGAEMYAGISDLQYVSKKDRSGLSLEEAMSSFKNAFRVLRRENAIYSDVGNFTRLHGDYIGEPRVSVQMIGRDSYSQMYKEYTAEADEILEEARKIAEPYFQIKFIHDELVRRIEYDYSGSRRLIWNALVEGKSVCQGYTNAFAYFMDSLDIENVIVIGTGNGGSHSWNYVKLDGKWYAVDVTWDDTANTDEYFLKGKSFLRKHKEEKIAENIGYPELADKDYLRK